MTRAALRTATAALVAAVALSGCPRPTPPAHGAATPEPRATATPGYRTFIRAEVGPDGGLQADGQRVAPADVPDPPTDVVWLTATVAPTPAALETLAALADVATARGWYLSARVVPSPGSGRPSGKTRGAPPEFDAASIDDAGRVTLGSRSALADEVRTLLPGGRCEAGQSISLATKNAKTEDFVVAAGFLAAAGCEVMILRNPTVRRVRE